MASDPIHLSNDIVTVRSPTPDDAPELAASVRFAYPVLRPWMPWATPDYGTDDALDWIHNRIEADAVPLLIIGDDGRIAGSTGLNHLDTQNLRANLGYWLRPDHGGNGYATAATQLVAAYGLDQLGLHRLEVIMSVENEPSRRVAERSGAFYEGVLWGRLRYHDRQHHAHSYAFVADGPRPGPNQPQPSQP